LAYVAFLFRFGCQSTPDYISLHMTSTMHSIAFLIACTALAGHGHRVQPSTSRLRSRESAVRQDLQKVVDADRPEALARLLWALAPDAGFTSSPLGGRLSTAKPTLSRLNHKSPVMDSTVTTEDVDRMMIPELKIKLKALKLPVSGKKADLVARLKEAMGMEFVAAPPTTAEATVAAQAKKMAPSKKVKVDKSLMPAKPVCSTEPGAHISQIIVVETPDDYDAVCDVVGSESLVTTLVGAPLKERLVAFKELKEKCPQADLVALLNHHGAGVRLRVKLSKKLKNIKHAFIKLDELPKDALVDKTDPRKGRGKGQIWNDEIEEVGEVADAFDDQIRSALRDARFCQLDRDKYTKDKLVEWGLLGRVEKWQVNNPITTHGRLVAQLLGLGRCTGVQLQESLNLFFLDEDINRALDMLPATEAKSVFPPPRPDESYFVAEREAEDKEKLTEFHTARMARPKQQRVKVKDFDLIPPRPDDVQQQVWWDAIFGGAPAEGVQGLEPEYEVTFTKDRSKAPPRPPASSELEPYWNALFGDLD